MGDGFTDDTEALQRAVATQANIYFPAGRYLLKGTLMLHTHQRITGSGWNSVLILNAGDFTAISAEKSSAVYIQDLKIEGCNQKNRILQKCILGQCI